ncbi:MAG: NAD(P)H-dependent oxidoreductase [Thermomicrobiales bacterium]|nr:NAD(P)H-dependent oxidoreductase [Thermomicrobiales bacterium]
MRGKPVGIASASSDRNGTVRAQMHLRQIFTSMGAVVIPEPEVYVTFAEDKFNQLGELSNHTAREQVKSLIENLADWALLLREQR